MKKRQIFQSRKYFGLFFCIIKCDKPQGTFDKGPEGILTNTVEVKGSLLQDLRGC